MVGSLTRDVDQTHLALLMLLLSRHEEVGSSFVWTGTADMAANKGTDTAQILRVPLLVVVVPRRGRR